MFCVLSLTMDELSFLNIIIIWLFFLNENEISF